MRPFRGVLSLAALAVLAMTGTPARAAWNNVFQVCCHDCGSTSATVAFAAPAAACPQPCPQPCPQQVCTTQYVQRSYYQPVTTYKQETYCEPVTTYRTSYYCEPVCTYRYSCYFDPCTCCYRQVATPVTSYRMRSRCDAVTSYLQRCRMVPVTSYQLACYYEPVTTCCTTTTGAPVATLPPGAPVVQPGAAAVPPGAAATPVPAGPGVGEAQVPIPRQPGGIGEAHVPGNGTSESRRLYPRETNPPPMGHATDPSSFRQPRLQQPVPPAPKPPRVQLDRIVSLPGPNLEGQVVRADQGAEANARLLFVSATREAQQSVTADEQGRFRATLASGDWLVYVRDTAGTPVFLKRIDVKEQPLQLTLVKNVKR